MFIDILNSADSKLSIGDEADLVRAAFLLSDQVGIAAKCSVFLDLESLMAHTEDKVILNLQKDTVMLTMRNDPNAVRHCKKAFEQYIYLSSRKSKSNKEAIRMMEIKHYLDLVRKHVLSVFKQVAIAEKVEDIYHFSFGKDNMVVLNSLGEDPAKDIRILLDVLTRNDDFILFNKRAFEVTAHASFPEVHNAGCGVFNGSTAMGFLYGDLISLEVPLKLPFDHFKVIRENLLAGTAPFRDALLNIRDKFIKIKFSKENIPVLEDYYVSLRRHALSFEILEKESLLLKSLYKAGSMQKRMKIKFAVTDYYNLISFFEELGIINRQVSLYLKEKVSQVLDPAMSLGFLIAEEEPGYSSSSIK